MEGFTLIHDACGQPAKLSYYITEGWHWVGTDDHEYEEPYDQYNLTLECTTCNVRLDPEPTDER